MTSDSRVHLVMCVALLILGTAEAVILYCIYCVI